MADSSTITTRSKKKKTLSTSHKTKKKNESIPKELSPHQEAENEPTANSTARNTSSPDPNCAICLGKLENKSFTDSCFHMFCFVCLLEWSKVKNECPLCKQSFKSIIHNVRSYEDYDQYHLSMYANHPPEHPYSRSFRYRTTLTEDRVFNLRSRVIGNPSTDPETVLQLQAVGAPPRLQLRVSDFSRQNWNRTRQAATSDFRRRIYANGMHLVGIRGSNDRVREASPAFFTRNPAQTHRLVPWLNRELNALLFHQESHVQFVLELIMGLIKRFGIRSEEFYEHVSPFIGRNTRHFMREFEMFAKCPYCMIVYDKKAMYEQLPESVSSESEVVNSISDNDSDVQILSTEAAPDDRTSNFINLPDISSEIQVSSTVYSPWGGPNILYNASWHSPTPGPSWSLGPIPALPARDYIPRLKRSGGLSEIDSSSNSSSSAGSDVMVVAYDKPWEERSPINLSSDSETEKRLLQEKLKEKKNKVKKKKSTKQNYSSTVSIPAIPDSRMTPEQGGIANERNTEEPTTSENNSQSGKHKHKSRSWRDSHYNNNRANVLFHRRSTSPEMSDSGMRKNSINSEPEETENQYIFMRHSGETQNCEHKQFSKHAQEESALELASTSRSTVDRSGQEKRRRESRSPSVEIISVHHKDKKKKKHKKHKHKHKSSHKHVKKVKSSVVVVNNTGEQPSENDTDAYEDESPRTIDHHSSVSSFTRTSETSGSTRSFTDVSTEVCETLNPVEIASSLAKKSQKLEDVFTNDGVLDLTAVNLEEVNDEVLDVGINELPSSLNSDHLSCFDTKSFKKHPYGHKKSRESCGLNEVDSNDMPPLPPSFDSSYSNVMMRGDPLFSRTESPIFYPNVLESFHSAFVSGYNPHAWYRHSIYPKNLSNSKLFESRSGISTVSSSKPNYFVDVDSYPLDLRRTQPPDSTKPNNTDHSVYKMVKSSTVTSSQTTSASDDESNKHHSPILDVVNVEKKVMQVVRHFSESEEADSSSKGQDSLVIDVYGSDDSDSHQDVDSTENLIRPLNSAQIYINTLLNPNPQIVQNGLFPNSITPDDESTTETDLDIVHLGQGERKLEVLQNSIFINGGSSNRGSGVDVELQDAGRTILQGDHNPIVNCYDSEKNVNSTDSEIDVDDSGLLDLSSSNQILQTLRPSPEKVSDKSAGSDKTKILTDNAQSDISFNRDMCGNAGMLMADSVCESNLLESETKPGEVSIDNNLCGVIDVGTEYFVTQSLMSSACKNSGSEMKTVTCLQSNLKPSTSRPQYANKLENANNTSVYCELPSSSNHGNVNPDLFFSTDANDDKYVNIDESSSSSSYELPINLKLSNSEKKIESSDKSVNDFHKLPSVVYDEAFNSNSEKNNSCDHSLVDENVPSTSNSLQAPAFWKKRIAVPIVNSSWRTDEMSGESDTGDLSSSTDSYDYDSYK